MFGCRLVFLSASLACNDEGLNVSIEFDAYDKFIS